MALQESKELDVGRLVRGVFQDQWMGRTGVGGLLVAAGLLAILYNVFFCLPIYVAIWAVIMGYSLRCMRVVIADPEAKLPLWNDWGDLFLSGITWIALQTGIWLFLAAILLLILGVAAGFAFNDKSVLLSHIWTTTACLLVSLVLGFMSVLSAYVMVHFAIEENSKAGFAYWRVARSLFRSPRKLLAGFFLAAGIQWLSVLLPCISIIGIFIIPTAFFVGTIVSAIVLARHWSLCTVIVPPAKVVTNEA